MKQITKLFLTLGLTALVSASSFAQSMMLQNPTLRNLTSGASYMSQLHTFNIEGDTLSKNMSGNVVIDLDKKEVALKVVTKITHCPRDLLCIQIVSPLPATVISTRLALTHKALNDCGEVTYTATRDLRTVDGNLETIQVTDRSHSTCGTAFSADAIIEVVYDAVENRTGVHNNATFGGEKLELLYKTQPIDMLK